MIFLNLLFYYNFKQLNIRYHNNFRIPFTFRQLVIRIIQIFLGCTKVGIKTKVYMAQFQFIFLMLHVLDKKIIHYQLVKFCLFHDIDIFA